MNYKFLIIIILFLYSCEATNIGNKKITNVISVETFSNKGFALVYSDNLKKEKLVNTKIDDRS